MAALFRMGAARSPNLAPCALAGAAAQGGPQGRAAGPPRPDSQLLCDGAGLWRRRRVSWLVAGQKAAAGERAADLSGSGWVVSKVVEVSAPATLSYACHATSCNGVHSTCEPALPLICSVTHPHACVRATATARLYFKSLSWLRLLFLWLAVGTVPFLLLINTSKFTSPVLAGGGKAAGSGVGGGLTVQDWDAAETGVQVYSTVSSSPRLATNVRTAARRQGISSIDFSCGRRDALETRRWDCGLTLEFWPNALTTFPFQCTDVPVFLHVLCHPGPQGGWQHAQLVSAHALRACTHTADGGRAMQTLRGRLRDNAATRAAGQLRRMNRSLEPLLRASCHLPRMNIRLPGMQNLEGMWRNDFLVCECAEWGTARSSSNQQLVVLPAWECSGWRLRFDIQTQALCSLPLAAQGSLSPTPGQSRCSSSSAHCCASGRGALPKR